jgi:hypothetical protein
MAQIFAIASGNFNNSTIWDSGSVPTSADDVYANGFTVTLNTNATVSSLRNSASGTYVPAIATPAMTSNSTPSGVVTGSAVSSGALWNVFDQSVSTGILTSSSLNAAVVQYQFPSAKTIIRYAIYTNTSNIARNPATWTFDGSNNGSTWTTLHSVTGAALALSSWYNYTFTNTTGYTYYRLNITAVQTAGQYPSFNELQMTESSSAATGGNVGGSFILPDGVTFTSTNGIVPGTLTPVLTYAGTTSATLYSAFFPTAATTGTTVNIEHTGTGNLIMYGNITGTHAYGGTTGTLSGIKISSNGTLTLNGSFTGLINTNSGVMNIRFIDVVGNNSTVNINGNINGTASSGSATSSAHPVYVSATSATINVTGNIVGGSRTGTANAVPVSCVNIVGSANVTVVGNVTGGSVTTVTTAATHGIFSTGGSIVVNGDVTGGTGPNDSTSCGIRTAGSVNITGTISSNTCQAVLVEGNSNLTITGNVTSNNAIAVSSSASTSTNNIAGNVTAGTAPCIYASSTATNIITGNLTNGTSGAMAFWGQKLYLGTSGSRTWTFYNTSAAAKILYTADLVSPAGSQPSVTDVRSGTTYALGTLTGTCVIPPKNSVTSGVPVDNTVGTALLTLSTLQTYAQAVWNTQTSAITTSGSIGERLKEASTVAITGQQIAGFDI